MVTARGLRRDANTSMTVYFTIMSQWLPFKNNHVFRKRWSSCTRTQVLCQGLCYLDGLKYYMYRSFMNLFGDILFTQCWLFTVSPSEKNVSKFSNRVTGHPARIFQVVVNPALASWLFAATVPSNPVSITRVPSNMLITGKCSCDAQEPSEASSPIAESTTKSTMN